MDEEKTKFSPTEKPLGNKRNSKPKRWITILIVENKSSIGLDSSRKKKKQKKTKEKETKENQRKRNKRKPNIKPKKGTEEQKKEKETE